MTDIKASEMSGIKLFNTGTKNTQAVHKIEEDNKLGTLRAGNTGALVGTSVIGDCHRKVLARFKGLQPKVYPESLGYFDAGFGNEAIWEQKYATLDGYDIRSEKDCPTKWTTSQGIDVTGSPDLMVFKDNKPILGLELKALAAINSATNIRFGDRPKTGNLLQTAHYSMIWETPFNLVYTFNGKGSAPWWAKKEYSLDKHNSIVVPFKSEFKLGWEQDKLYYLNNQGTRVDTIITKESITNFYELVVDMSLTKNLYDRPSNAEFDGSRGKFNMCDYCPFQETCDKYEGDYDTWLDHIKLVCDTGE